MKKILAATVAGGLLLGGTGVAWAASGGGSDPTPSTTAAPDATAPTGGRGLAAARGALKVAADTIHVDQQTLVSELRAGKTVADVANEHQVAPQTVVDAIVAAGKTRIATALTNGTLTQAQADKATQRLPDLATKLVNRHFGAGRAANGRLPCRPFVTSCHGLRARVSARDGRRRPTRAGRRRRRRASSAPAATAAASRRSGADSASPERPGRARTPPCRR
jgi:hypothetical protein